MWWHPPRSQMYFIILNCFLKAAVLSWLPQLSVRRHNMLYKKKRHVLKISHVRKCVVLVSYASIPPFLKVPHHQHLFLQQSPAYPSARPPIRSISYNRPESNIEPFSSGFGHLHPHGYCRSCPTEYNGRFYLQFWILKSMSSCSCSAELRCSQRWGGEGHRELRIASPPLAQSSSSSHSRTLSSFLFVEEKFFSHSSCKQD